MFFSRALTQTKEAVKEADSILDNSLDNYFKEHLAEMKQELVDAGIPEEYHQKFLNNLRNKAKVTLIDETKKEAKKFTLSSCS